LRERKVAAVGLNVERGEVGVEVHQNPASALISAQSRPLPELISHACSALVR
jgi:hypothetical protein